MVIGSLEVGGRKRTVHPHRKADDSRYVVEAEVGRPRAALLKASASKNLTGLRLRHKDLDRTVRLEDCALAI